MVRETELDRNDATAIIPIYILAQAALLDPLSNDQLKDSPKIGVRATFRPDMQRSWRRFSRDNAHDSTDGWSPVRAEDIQALILVFKSLAECTNWPRSAWILPYWFQILCIRTAWTALVAVLTSSTLQRNRISCEAMNRWQQSST